MNEISDALPGLLLIVAPVVIVSYVLFWVEDVVYVRYHGMHGPVIALMIAAIAAIAVTNIWRIPDHLQLGLGFTTKWLLKVCVILYGLNFTYAVWFQPGAIWLFAANIATVVVANATAYYQLTCVIQNIDKFPQIIPRIHSESPSVYPIQSYLYSRCLWLVPG